MKNINLIAPLNVLGFGVFSFLYYKILKEAGYEVNWSLIGHPSAEDIYSLCNNFSKDFNIDPSEVNHDACKNIDPSAPSLTIWHPNELNRAKVRSNVANIGFTHFETSTLVKQEVQAMSELDNVLVCSKWAADTMYVSGMPQDKCSVAPGICAPMHMNAKGTSASLQKVLDYLSSTDSTLVSSGGKWESRKAQYLQVEALEHIEQPITLLACWSNVFTGGLGEAFEYLHKNDWKITSRLDAGDFKVILWEKGIHRIVSFPFLQDMNDLHQVMCNSSFYLNTSKGEGWDQPLVEAMGMGVPCIATNNTAHTEYCTRDNSILIECNREIANDGRWFRGNKGYWYPPTLQSVVDSINAALAMSPKELSTMSSLAKSNILKTCSNLNILSTLESYIDAEHKSTI